MRWAGMFTSIDPATGESGATYPELTDNEVEERVARAAAAFREWRVSEPEARADLLRRIADRFEVEADRLAAIATAEMGKTLKSAKAEVMKCVAGFRYYAEHGPGVLEPRRTPVAGGVAEAR